MRSSVTFPFSQNGASGVWAPRPGVERRRRAAGRRASTRPPVCGPGHAQGSCPVEAAPATAGSGGGATSSWEPTGSWCRLAARGCRPDEAWGRHDAAGRTLALAGHERPAFVGLHLVVGLAELLELAERREVRLGPGLAVVCLAVVGPHPAALAGAGGVETVEGGLLAAVGAPGPASARASLSTSAPETLPVHRAPVQGALWHRGGTLDSLRSAPLKSLSWQCDGRKELDPCVPALGARGRPRASGLARSAARVLARLRTASGRGGPRWLPELRSTAPPGLPHRPRRARPLV